MPLTSYNITPDNLAHPDTIGIYPMTFGGNIENSYDRIRAAAELVGHSILLVELTGQDGLNINGMAPRDALAPKKLRETSRYFTNEMAPLIEEYPVRLGIGHSSGAILTAAMVIHGGSHFGDSRKERVFNGVNLTDGINLRSRFEGTQFAITGYTGYLAYQAKDMLLQAIPFTDDKAEVPARYDPDVHGLPPDSPSLITNMRNVGELMRSQTSKNTAIALARLTSVPLYSVGLNHGLSGPRDRVESFHISLQLARQQAAKSRLRVYADNPVAPLRTEMATGWHSRLMNPKFVAQQLKTTRDMAVEYRQKIA